MDPRFSTAKNFSARMSAILTALVTPFAKRFVAGTTLTEALEKVRLLHSLGFRTTLDYLGESVTRREEAERATEKYVLILRALREKGLEAFVSIKLTQLGLDIDREFCVANLRRIAQAAEAAKGFVRVDMEGSSETSATLDAIRAVKTNRSVPLGAVLQAMLKRTPEDLMDLMQREIPIRLCKGAYKEPVDVALQDPIEIRERFLSLAKRLLLSGTYHAIATHDRSLIDRVSAFVREQGIDSSRFEFQMLLGIERRLQERIRDQGYTMRIYVPFGSAWLPYMLRRLRERKENLLFFFKQLFVR